MASVLQRMAWSEALMRDLKGLNEDFEEYEEVEEDVDSICDEIESIADKMRISDCEVTYTIQGNTNKGIPYFSIKVKVNGRVLCSYGIEPGEDMDRKRTSIMRSVKRYSIESVVLTTLICKFKHLRQNRCNQYLKRAAIIAALFIFTLSPIETYYFSYEMNLVFTDCDNLDQKQR